MNLSNSDCCDSVAAGGCDGGVASAAVDPSRGKKVHVETAPPRKRTVMRMANGLATNDRRSVSARRGNVVMGNGVFDPVRKNSATTAAAIVRHRMHTVLRTTNETYSKYRTTAIAAVD